MCPKEPSPPFCTIKKLGLDSWLDPYAGAMIIHKLKPRRTWTSTAPVLYATLFNQSIDNHDGQL